MPSFDSKDIKSRYFTLIEILTAVAILGILTVGLYEVQRGIQRIWLKTERSMKIRQNARIVLNLIESDLKGMVVKNFEEQTILMDAKGIGERDFAFITNNLKNKSSNSTLFEVGYGVNSNRLLRWETGDGDGLKWNFLNTLPEQWANDNSWGSVNTVIEGVIDFNIQFYKRTSIPPYHASFDFNTDSDKIPAFAKVSLSLVHPKTMNTLNEKDELQTYDNVIIPIDFY